MDNLRVCAYVSIRFRHLLKISVTPQTIWHQETGADAAHEISAGELRAIYAPVQRTVHFYDQNGRLLAVDRLPETQQSASA